MHKAIALALASLPVGTDTPRGRSFDIPETFDVDRDSLRFNVHIRTKTPEYLAGWPNNATKERWESDCQLLMGEIGFEKDKGWFYPSDGARTEYLYTHPDDISGVITLPRVLALHAAIERGDFGIVNRNIDVYEVFEDLTENELKRRLDHYKNAIREQIIEAHKTTRKTKFKTINPVVMAMELPGLSLLGENRVGRYGTGPLMGVLTEYVEAVRQELIGEGWLFALSHNSQTFYRTANKTEQKAMKLSIAA